MRSSRESPDRKTLERNNITIRRPNWPEHVLYLSSHLLQPFSYVVPKSKLNLDWGQKKPPRDAFDPNKNSQQRREKEAMIDAALDVKRKCEDLIQRQTAQEGKWNGLWTAIFERHVTAIHEDHGGESHPVLAHMTDAIFSKTVNLYDVEKCVLTSPKPDITLAFQTCAMKSRPGAGSRIYDKNKCFSRETIEDLRKDKAKSLIPSPFSDKHPVCFPWGIYEGKSRDGNRLDPECQAANAAVKCIKLLEKLAKPPNSPSEYEMSGRDILPIPCITCRAQKWELWICYRSDDGNYEPTYELEKIFGGDMTNLWSCVQLVYIVERLRDWALDTFRPWIQERLQPWIGYPEKQRLHPQLDQDVKSCYDGGEESEGDSGFFSGEEEEEEEEEEAAHFENSEETILPPELRARSITGRYKNRFLADEYQEVKRFPDLWRPTRPYRRNQLN